MNMVIKEQGIKGLFKGWAPTMVEYTAQGAFKYGFYEFFKKYYSDIAGAEYAAKYKTLIYLAGSASAEVISHVSLCPMEAVKMRMQTQPGFSRWPAMMNMLPPAFFLAQLHSFLCGLQFVKGHWSAMGTRNSL